MEPRSLDSPRPAPSLRSRWLKVGAALVLGCLSAEGIARLSPPPIAAPIVRGALHRETKNEDQLFENRPGGRLVVDFPGTAEGKGWTVVHEINEQGFRGPLVEVAPEEGGLRIVCLGDSHTFGHGVNEDETWPAHLQAQLAGREAGLPIEVINGGVDGYDPHQELVWLKRRVLPLQPTMVLLQIHLNDAAARRQAKRERSPGLLFTWTHPEQAPSFLRALRSFSRAVDATLRTVHARKQLEVYYTSMTSLYIEDADGWERAQEAVREMKVVTRRRDIRFGVVLYPSLFKMREGLLSDDGFAFWHRFLEEEGIPYLDTSDAFRDVDLGSLRVHPHDFHANGTANELFATEVAAWIGSEARLR